MIGKRQLTSSIIKLVGFASPANTAQQFSPSLAASSPESRYRCIIYTYGQF